MKSGVQIILGLAIVAAAIFLGMRYIDAKKDVDNGLKNIDSEMQMEEEEESIEEVMEVVENEQAMVASACTGIAFTNIAVGQTVSFPLSVEGTVHPTGSAPEWSVFEGEAGVIEVLDANDNVLSGPHLISFGGIDWMNTDPKAFVVAIPGLGTTPTSSDIKIVARDNNPSGGEGTSHTCVVPVTL